MSIKSLMLRENVVRINQQSPSASQPYCEGCGSVCVKEKDLWSYKWRRFRDIEIEIMIIMIAIILQVYCNIIDALVQVTSLIFLQTTLMKWFIKQSHESWSFQVWKLLLQWLKLCSNENKYRYIICSSVVFLYNLILLQLRYKIKTKTDIYLQNKTFVFFCQKSDWFWYLYCWLCFKSSTCVTTAVASRWSVPAL